MKTRHRLRPQLSAATRAKAQIVALTARIDAARKRGDHAEVQKLEDERAWLTVNSITP